MKRFFFAFTVLAGLTSFVGSVSAADPVGESAYDWTGFYIGAQAGYVWGDSDIDDDISFDPNVDVEGFSAGGLLGAQWQINQFVLGIEGEGNWTDADGETEFSLGNFATSDVDWFGSVSGKLGFAWDRMMLFGTAGIAFADASTGQDIPTLTESFSNSESFTGYTVGAGIDYAMTDNVIVGIQYRYYDFGTESTVPQPFFTPRDFDLTLNTVSAHLEFKF